MSLVSFPPGEELDIKIYREKVRPLLFEALHIIDNDFTIQIQKLDSDIGQLEFSAEMGDCITHDQDLICSYNKMIDLITAHYSSSDQLR